MRVSEIRTDELGEAERAAWDGFLRPDGAPASAFMDWRFARAVGEARADARIAVIEDEAGIAAFLPYHRRPLALARPIGAPFSDQHGPVIRPGAAPDLRAALRSVGLSAYIYSDMPAAAARVAGGAFAAHTAYAADTGGDPDAYLQRKAAEHAKRFRTIRWRGRKMEREHGEAAIAPAETDPQVLRQLIAIKRRQYQRTGLHDVLAADWVEALFLRLLEDAGPDSGLRVTTLRLDGALAAGQIWLQSGPALCGVLTTYDEAFATYSPGLQLLLGLMARAPELGVSRFEFGAGHGDYKSVFADPAGELAEGAMCADGAAGALRRLSADAWRAAETAPLGPVAALAGKARRRHAQIASAETHAMGRARGYLAALTSGGTRAT